VGTFALIQKRASQHAFRETVLDLGWGFSHAGSGGMKLIFFGRFETHGLFGGFSSAASLKKVLLRRVDFLPPANRIEE
jgi:hypothetical protein